MLIATWNVNSIRTRIEQVKDWLKEVKPDVLCIQETKVTDELFPQSEFDEIGYKVCFHGQKSYNGVALISPHEISDVRLGFEGELPGRAQSEVLGLQKRIISAMVNEVRIVNVYVPNGSSLNSDKYSYKIEWLKYLYQYLKEQEKRNEPLCLVGDFNIALEDKDIHNPERLAGGIMASEIERDALSRLLGERLHDVFRVFESATNHWTWWDYRSGAWDRDRGWRIDHIYLSEILLENALSCQIHKEIRGNVQPSDHAPVIVDITWPPEAEVHDSDELLIY